MEDESEDAVVDEFVVGIVGFLQSADVTVEEAQLTAEVTADGRGTDAAPFAGEALAQQLHDMIGLDDGLGRVKGLLRNWLL